MNRRSFMRTLAGAVAGFTVLPPATTYERVWRASRVPSMGVKFWVAEEYLGEWRWVTYADNGLDLVRLEQRFNPLIADMPVQAAPRAIPAWRSRIVPQFAELRTIESEWS